MPIVFLFSVSSTGVSSTNPASRIHIGLHLPFSQILVQRLASAVFTSKFIITSRKRSPTRKEDDDRILGSSKPQHRKH
ncbi:hypothetical protein X975_21523, partial [Stegodyphus mimosarum]